MKILIVEDNKQMRCLIRCVVSDLAETVYECSDGSKALAAYARQQPDWVLMDIKMANTDGIAATQQITAAFPGARVIMVTDYDDTDLREAAREAGAVHYVIKEDLLTLPKFLAASQTAAPDEPRMQPQPRRR